MTTDLGKAAALLKAVQHVTVLTGAGVSKESGIPTFREAQTGLWAEYDPEKLASPHGFLKDPALVWRWYDGRRQKISQVSPNQGHYALVELEKFVERLTLVTQNVDGLHALAGSTRVVELHGNISRVKCFDNNHPATNVPLGLSEPPLCSCGSLLRPDVVWFGEALSPSNLAEAMEASRTSNLMLIIGTSGLVHPAASLPYLAKQHGAKIIEVNPNESALTEIADLFLKGPSAQILPGILSLMNESVSKKQPKGARE